MGCKYLLVQRAKEGKLIVSPEVGEFVKKFLDQGKRVFVGVCPDLGCLTENYFTDTPGNSRCIRHAWLAEITEDNRAEIVNKTRSDLIGDEIETLPTAEGCTRNDCLGTGPDHGGYYYGCGYHERSKYDPNDFIAAEELVVEPWPEPEITYEGWISGFDEHGLITKIGWQSMFPHAKTTGSLRQRKFKTLKRCRMATEQNLTELMVKHPELPRFVATIKRCLHREHPWYHADMVVDSWMKLNE